MARLLVLALIVAACHHIGVCGRHEAGHVDTEARVHQRGDVALLTASRGLDVAAVSDHDASNNTEVVAQVGGTATLRCYTHNGVGEEIVSWLKKDDNNLLTAGVQVYSSEAKYSVSHARHQKLWELSLRDVRMSDAGLYECQLTTHPPTSTFFTLTVVEARAEVHGGPEMHVQTGEPLQLHCSVTGATEPPLYIFWFHNGTMVNFAPASQFRFVKHSYGSSLAIASVTWNHAGDYRCEPHLATPANLTLHVVAGEKHAALHNGQNDDAGGDETTAASASLQLLTGPPLLSCCLLLLLTCCWLHAALCLNPLGLLLLAPR